MTMCYIHYQTCWALRNIHEPKAADNTALHNDSVTQFACSDVILEVTAGCSGAHIANIDLDFCISVSVPKQLILFQ